MYMYEGVRKWEEPQPWEKKRGREGGGEVNGTCQDTVIHVMFTEIKYLKLNDSERATEWTEEWEEEEEEEEVRWKLWDWGLTDGNTDTETHISFFIELYFSGSSRGSVKVLNGFWNFQFFH